jgi:hypothetical protein
LNEYFQVKMMEEIRRFYEVYGERYSLSGGL